MGVSRTTVLLSEILMNRLYEKIFKNKEDSLTKFFNRATLNQLEKEGDFEIRDLYEREIRENGKDAE